MPLILGLTGSLGSGKTFVSSLLSQCRASVICADKLAREATERGSTVLGEIVRHFGPDIILRDGSLNRPKMAAIVFDDPRKRETLEGLIHPYVRKRIREELEKLGNVPLAVLDIPLLFESEYEWKCDKTLVVSIDDDTRFERLERDRGISRAEAQARLAAQMPQEEKMRRADFVVDNSGTREQTARQLSQILLQLFPGGLPEPLKAPIYH